jgi:hypothetical protein
MTSIVTAVLIAIGGLLWVPPAQAPTGAAPPAETPTQFYARYRATVASASALDEIVALWATDAAKEFRDAPPSQRVDLAGVKRMNAMLSNVKVTGETPVGVDGTAAELALEAVGPDQKKITGKVHIVKEGGTWKLSEPEQWQ